jgi:hypothetical protein
LEGRLAVMAVLLPLPEPTTPLMMIASSMGAAACRGASMGSSLFIIILFSCSSVAAFSWRD